MSTRPPGKNVPSKYLSNEENQQLFLCLGHRCLTMATAIVQVFTTLSPYDNDWIIQCTGILCLVKDSNVRSYFFRVYDAQDGVMIWEHEIYKHMNYSELTSYLHTFEGDNGAVGFSFAMEDEASLFKEVVWQKLRKASDINRGQAQRQNESARQMTMTGSSSSLAPSLSSPRGEMWQQTLPKTGSTSNTHTLKKKKNISRKLTKADIGTPLTFKHITHVGWNSETGFDSFNLDEAWTSFLAQAGVTPKDLKNKRTSKIISNFIAEWGGRDAVLQALQEEQATPTIISPPLPPRNQTLRRPTNTSKPPAPAPNVLPPPVSPRRPPVSQTSFKPTLPGNKATRPPPSPSSGFSLPVSTRSTSSTAPPPPPPPPTSGSLLPVSTRATSGTAPQPPPPPPLAPAVPPVQEKSIGIHPSGAKTLDRVGGRTAGEDARGDLLSEIRKGYTLKRVKESDKKKPADSPAAAVSGLAAALSKALAERSKVLRSDDEGSDDDSDNNNTEEDDWDD